MDLARGKDQGQRGPMPPKCIAGRCISALNVDSL